MTAIIRPVALGVLFDNIPAELRETPAWVMWRYELNEKGKWTKPPKTTKGGNADTTKPVTWTTFDLAREAYQRGGFDGVGFVLTNGIAGVDLDHAIDADGVVKEPLRQIADRFVGTYRERSPSGEGFRVFAHGAPTRCGKGARDKSIEVYARASPRYLTVTGHALDDVREITDQQSALDWLHAEHMEKRPRAPAAPASPTVASRLADAEVIELARKAKNGDKFTRLWFGDAGDYGGDASAADAALVAILAYWTAKDHAQIDRLFRRSGLMRDKWDSKRGDSTYGADTIAEMIARTDAVFEPRPAPTAQDIANAEAIMRSGRSGTATGGDSVGEGTETPGNGGNAPAGDSGATAWPAPMDAAALHGIAGEFVRMIEPRTESDPAAILAQFLVAFGALVGRGPHYRVEGDQHHANLFALLVGATAKGRKGTSWGRVREAFELVTDWKPHVSGLSSGEGLKWNVRDMQETTKPNKNGELVTEIVDEGVTDKRLLVTESEFAGALRAVQRQGNTLSATVRESWDTGNLRTLTKNDPITATGAHVCIIGHVTTDELRAELSATDTANGFANRFLFVGVRRSKLLPFGGAGADEGEVQAFAIRLRELAAKARARERLTMTNDAQRIWATVYPQLSEGGGGLHGAVTARAEAQCIRLALVYALLDGAAEIDAPHLMAALAVWSYCDATARYVFGASLGDRIADEIMRRLRAAGDVGVTRTDLRDAFGRHQTAERIGAALDLLRRKGEAQCATEQTGGRPTETWRATKAT